MKSFLPEGLSLLLVVPLAVGPALAQEVALSTAGAPYAPLDVSKHSGLDPNVPLSSTQRHDLLGQFEGLVHLGLRNVSYERWEGRSMSDCDKPGSQDRWAYKCEIITGEGNGFYYFYPNESRQSATLQHLDIQVHAADSNLLDDFRKPLQQMFGRATVVEKPSVTGRAKGPVRHWNTGSDIADLFIDTSIRPEGSVRFVWMRSPLVAGAHVKAEETQ